MNSQCDSAAVSQPPTNSATSVLGIGTDIIECDRIARMIERHGDLFLQRVFTVNEIEYCKGRKMAYQHYAGRWAAKEAVLKSLGTGWARGIKWTDVELLSQAGGQPTIALHNRALEVSTQMGIATILISISHTRGNAVAFATAIGGTSNETSQKSVVTRDGDIPSDGQSLSPQLS